MLRIYIDGDAFPNLLKPIIFRQIEKYGIKTCVFANKKINIGKSKNIEYVIVDAGADEADNKIVQKVHSGDLVITADIPLADRVIDKNAHAIDHRGELYSKDNIKQYLAMRNLMENIREMGEMTQGPKPFGSKDAELFANQLNMFLQKHMR
ncbi:MULTISPECIES: YaiI/YqxD family protein [Sulfurimonas]|uniref:YaiI/YqxD family protein n=1 Tax=Sulfurimonas TaxID=202746 RepID=UPI00125F443B|nr:YaiI/YqxD family protein [Sulfurimonas hydrogeniphila]